LQNTADSTIVQGSSIFNTWIVARRAVAIMAIEFNAIFLFEYLFFRENQVSKKDVVFKFAEIFSGAFTDYFQRSKGKIKVMVSLLTSAFLFFLTSYY